MRQKNADEILVSYDVTPLFTDVPADETIQLLADKNTTAELNDEVISHLYRINRLHVKSSFMRRLTPHQ